MDPGKIFQIITNSTLLATRLLSEPGRGFVEFSQSRYCAVVSEATPISGDVITVSAIHSKNGPIVRYSITDGNEEGIFKIDQTTGVISLAAPLDFERKIKHELVVLAEAVGGVVGSAHVRVIVEDVNDSPPIFLKANPVVTVIEEDDRHLPAVIATVSAMDLDALDKDGVTYRVEGDGIDGYTPDEVFFTINKWTGELIQHKALDRDPPHGKGVWKLTVEATDGQVSKKRHEEENTIVDSQLLTDESEQTFGEYHQNRDYIDWPTWTEDVQEENGIWKETLSNKRSVKSLPRDTIKNFGGEEVTSSKPKTNFHKNSGGGEPSVKTKEVKRTWDHRRERHNDYKRTDSLKLNREDKNIINSDTRLSDSLTEIKDKTKQRYIVKRSYWKEVKVDPSIHADFMIKDPDSRWQKIEANRNEKKQTEKRLGQGVSWKINDFKKYPWKYREEDVQNFRGNYWNTRYLDVWGNEENLGSREISNMNTERELTKNNLRMQAEHIKGKIKERHKRESLEHNPRDGSATTEKWREYKPKLPRQEFGLGYYILKGRALRGASDQQSRRLLESRLRRLSSQETGRTFDQNQGKSLGQLLENSLDELVEEGRGEEEGDHVIYEEYGSYDSYPDESGVSDGGGGSGGDNHDQKNYGDDSMTQLDYDEGVNDDYDTPVGYDNAERDDHGNYESGSNNKDLSDLGEQNFDDVEDIGIYDSNDYEDHETHDILHDQDDNDNENDTINDRADHYRKYNDDDDDDDDNDDVEKQSHHDSGVDIDNSDEIYDDEYYEEYDEDDDSTYDNNEYEGSSNDVTDANNEKFDKKKTSQEMENKDKEGNGVFSTNTRKITFGETQNEGYSLNSEEEVREGKYPVERRKIQNRRNISNQNQRKDNEGSEKNLLEFDLAMHRPKFSLVTERVKVRTLSNERNEIDTKRKRKRDENELHQNHKKKLGESWQELDQEEIIKREVLSNESNNIGLNWKGEKMSEVKMRFAISDEPYIEENTHIDFIHDYQLAKDAERLRSLRHSNVKRENKRRVALNRKHKEKGRARKLLKNTKLFKVSTKDDSKPLYQNVNAEGYEKLIGEESRNYYQATVSEVFTQKLEECKKCPAIFHGELTEDNSNNQENPLNQTHSQNTNSQREIKLRHQEPGFLSATPEHPYDMSKSTSSDVTIYFSSSEKVPNEQKKRKTRMHRLPFKEPPLNLSHTKHDNSRAGRYDHNFSSSMVKHPHLPESTEGPDADEGITIDKEKSPKEPGKTDYISRTLHRRELRQDQEEESEGGCSRANIGDYRSGSHLGPYQENYSRRVHKVTTTVTVIVKDINDNAPVFPENVMMGEVYENGQSGVSVVRITAWDADDSVEGVNGRVTYSIEKNVIDEDTGRAIFDVNPTTGLIQTSLCCLDRETTPEYQIQVVATDGGGLKGTGTVVIRIDDENDNSPEFPSERFELEMDETWGNEEPDDIEPIMEVTCFDPDVDNEFIYRIIEDSGRGWDYFTMRSEGRVGQLFPRKPLDYENPKHRRELAFKLQVTDRGEEGWKDPDHMDTAWVKVQILDVNDNAPTFDTAHTQLSIMENAPKGTKLASFHAHDPDKGGDGQVDYKIVDHEDILEIDLEGVVRIKTDSLDRESLKEDTPIIRITAVDRGQPPLTSTATLSLSIMDINDSPPYLLPPTVFHIPEGAPPTRLGLLKAYDEDSWSLGNGPPFNISLASTNPDHIREIVDLQFSKKLDIGRGAATLWTKKPIDREKHHQLDVQVTLTDARGLNNTQAVTIVVDDVNDNPMKPGKKTIYLYKIQGRGGSLKVPLGRVYVEDPDDWDLKDKTFKWATSSNPLFSLDQQDGTIYASSQLREGRYLLEFSVNDRVSRQRGVSANVTVIVKTLEYRTLLNAAPITLYPATPTKITKGWNPVEGGGVLGRLIDEILVIVGKGEHLPEVVSVYGNNDSDNKDGRRLRTEPTRFSSLIVRHQQHSPDSLASSSAFPSADSSPSMPVVSVWLTVRNRTGGDFMNPVKLKGLLSLHRPQLEASTGLNVTIEGMENIYLGLKNKYRHQNHRSSKHATLKYQYKAKDKMSRDGSGSTDETHLEHNGREKEELKGQEASKNKDFYTTRYNADASGGPSTMASVSSSVVHLQVIDTNNTSIVTPRLKHFYDCKTPPVSQSSQEQVCLPGSCLNGGRCVQFSDRKRCICPGGSVGYNCKILSRTFMGSGWSWLPSIPPCFPSTMSLKILTKQKEALLLYSGPIEITNERVPFMAIQLSDGYPELVTDSWAGTAKLRIDTKVNDGSWHTIHVKLDNLGISMISDACGQGWSHQSNDTHCAGRALWTHPERLGSWVVSSPLQVGGLAQDGEYQNHGWAEGPKRQALHGCVSHLTINGELLDLGVPPLSQGSVPGCQMQDEGCVGEASECNSQETCQNEPQESRCTCKPGFTGSKCQQLTIPATLGPSSYYKVALSFTPSQYMLTLQIRMKAQGQPEGLLINVADSHVQHSLSVQLHAGKACLEESRNGEKLQIVCIEGFLIGDNAWHLLRAERYGHNLKISVDDGDGILQNESFPSLATHSTEEWITEMPVPLEVNRNDGVTIGGMPEYSGTKLLAVHNDLKGVCIDDLRISGHQIPIPPGTNNSKWGQVTTQEALIQGCVLPDLCQNFTCNSPLTCSPTWPEPSCSCGYGLQPVGRSCRDINECLWSPCLNGGSCHNLHPGYFCHCDRSFLGENCQFRKWDTMGRTFTAQALIATVSVSLLVLVLLGLIFSIRHHCLRNQRSLQSQDKHPMSNNGASIKVLNGDKPGGGGKRQASTVMMKSSLTKTSSSTASAEEVEVVIMKESPHHDPHLEFMERLRLSHQTSSLVQNEGKEPCTSTISQPNETPEWDQRHRSPSKISYELKGAEVSLSEGVHIATLSNGNDPG